MGCYIFHLYLDGFIVVYLDDIVYYSKTIEEHLEHLRKVFEVLKDNELFIKKKKNSFADEEVMFLGPKINDKCMKIYFYCAKLINKLSYN